MWFLYKWFYVSQIEEMIESGVDEMNPELAKLYDKQNDLELCT